MAKGKKFNAAEKHFQGKIDDLHKIIKHKDEMLERSRIKLNELNNEVSTLYAENNQLRDWVNRLLEYTELSKEDIKKACEKDKQIASLFTFMNNSSVLRTFM